MINSLEDAIKHCEEVAVDNESMCEYNLSCSDSQYREWKHCAAEHRQLVEWLRELKGYRNVRRILSQNRILIDSYGEVVLWDDIKRVLMEVNADETN